jgi:nicotinic acetylcholine receptor
MPASELFTPDIVLYNNPDTRLEDKLDALVVISENGSILWKPQSVFHSSCAIDTKYFPFDIQNCSLRFASWTFGTNELDLVLANNKSFVDLEDYTPSNEWQILSAPIFRNIKAYNLKNLTDITVYFVLQRYGGFLAYILILPCVLLSILTMVSNFRIRISNPNSQCWSVRQLNKCQ